MYSQIRNISIVCITLIALGGFFQKATAANEEEMRAAMQGMLDSLNFQDVAQMSSYWTDDIVYDFVAQPPSLEGKEQVAAFFGGLFQGVPDFHSTQTRILVSDNIMVTEAVGTGTHLGELVGIPATGNSLQVLPLHIWEFEGDKVRRATEYLDMASAMVQLGVMPAPDPLDPALLVPSFTLPDAEPTGLSPVEAGAQLDAHWDAHDLSGCAKGIHPDAEILMIPLGVPMDREGFIAISELEFQGFSDFRWEPVRSIDMGDGWVVTETVSTGTHDGPYLGIPATGRSIMVRAGVLRRFDADGLLTNLHLYYDNMTVLQQLTAEEWSPEGVWITTVPTPMGNMIIKSTWVWQDAAKTRLTGESEQINTYRVLIDVYPDAEEVKFAGGLAVKIGLNKYEMTAVEYFTKTSGPSLEEIVGIGIVSGTFELVDPDLAQGLGTGAYYMPEQDADQDGFPDEGQEPAVCVPWEWMSKRLTTMPGCVPMPEPEPEQQTQ